VLTAGIASGDANSVGQLLASLQQTGLVSTVKQWAIPLDRFPDGTEAIPDIVLLDLGRDSEPFFALGAHLRRLRPAVRLVACSSTSPPHHQLLLDAMRIGVQDFVSKPASPEALREVLARFDEEGVSKEQRAAENAKLIVVMGSKGGVGTTTVAVNLGIPLHLLAHKRVVLLDFAQPLGNVHLLLDLHPRFGIRDAVESLDRLDTHFLGGLLTQHKSKLEILGGTSQPEEWQNIPVASLARVINVARASFDIVLVDMGAQFSSDWGPVLATAHMILLVAEANVPSLWALERRLVALTGFGIHPERLGVVINRWHKGDEEILKSIEKNIKRPVFAFLPNDFRKANTAVNLGIPLMENHNVLTNRYHQLATQLAGLEAVPVLVEKRTGLSSFFSFPGRS
jgi:pilus assembly protein CpaE